MPCLSRACNKARVALALGPPILGHGEARATRGGARRPARPGLAFPTLIPVPVHLALIAMASPGDEMGGGHMYAFRPNGQKVSSQDSATQRCLYTPHALLARSARRATKCDSPTTCAPGRGQSDPQRGGPARHPRLSARAAAAAALERLLAARRGGSGLWSAESRARPNSVSSRPP